MDVRSLAQNRAVQLLAVGVAALAVACCSFTAVSAVLGPAPTPTPELRTVAPATASPTGSAEPARPDTATPTTPPGPTSTPQPEATETPPPTATPLAATASPTPTHATATASPPPAPTHTPLPAGHALPVGRDCPDGFPIKGYQTDQGERFYLVPSGGQYRRTVPDECFASESAAQAAGYHRASR